MACDLCGKTGTRLSDLLTIYQTKDVQQICPDCTEVVNKHLSKVKSVTHNILVELMNRFFKERKQGGGHE